MTDRTNAAPENTPEYRSPTVTGFREQQRRAGRWSAEVSDAVTRFSGSTKFVVLHVIWFTGWIVYNIVAAKKFDPFPFGLLTLIVSLEAIFLSTFVLISQNRQASESDARALIDFKTNIYSEAISELIADKLGVQSKAITIRYQQRLKEAAAKEDSASSATEAGVSE